jgi:hypothetical protein
MISQPNVSVVSFPSPLSRLDCSAILCFINLVASQITANLRYNATKCVDWCPLVSPQRGSSYNKELQFTTTKVPKSTGG